MKSSVALTSMLVLAASAMDPSSLSDRHLALAERTTEESSSWTLNRHRSVFARADKVTCDTDDIQKRVDELNDNIPTEVDNLEAARCLQGIPEIKKREGTTDDWIKYSEDLEKLAKDVRDCVSAAPGLSAGRVTAAAVGSLIAFIVWS
ncbi:uncharacterized protein DNG_04516 [Cephalotrichum gorgonifer]|uniref:Uncharacterized protein n=1 Tax=Cephalotrichum gorgonifer TaxID=2041049 RepID=A0AAE8SUM1_9PEZI|nr:uncharacterized protein DNG_04516 [Cephalotrichum gorgonifer]